MGSSVIREMAAVRGQSDCRIRCGGRRNRGLLDPEKVLSAVEESRDREEKELRASVVNYPGKGEIIYGAAEGSSILERECDLLFPAALENA